MSERVEGAGNANGQLMIVTDFPGETDEQTGLHFSGFYGSMLSDMLRRAGTSRGEVWFTSLSKIRPKSGHWKELGYDSVSACAEELSKEIKEINPNCILVLPRASKSSGSVVMKVLTGKSSIKDYRGSILRSTLNSKVKVVGTYHPETLQNREINYSMKVVMEWDIEKAVLESQTNTLELPDRNLMICKSSSQLYDFLDRYSDRNEWSIDIESLACIPVCIGLAPSKSQALSIPIINSQSFFNDKGIGDHDLAEIWNILISFFKRKNLKLIGQNFKYDHEKLIKTCNLPIPNPYFDTMLAGHTLHPEFPKGLGFLGSIYTREPYWKDEGKEWNPKKQSINDLFLYNAKDAAVTFEIYEEMLKDLEELELKDYFFNQIMPLHELYMHIESNGFLVNERRRKELDNQYTVLIDRAREEFEEVTGIKVVNALEQKKLIKEAKKAGVSPGLMVNLSSPLQLKSLLFGFLGFPKRAATDEDTLVGLLGNHCSKDEKKKRSLEIILDDRRYKKTKSTYIDASPDYDGRMRTNYNIVGTKFGRTSTSILEPPIRPDKIGFALHTLTKHGDVGAEVRSMYEPDEDCCFLEGDLSQVQVRIVAMLSDDFETLTMLDTIDIHKFTASGIFGIDINTITKESPTRQVGKTVRYTGLFGAHKKRLMLTINNDIKRFHIDMDPVSEWKAGQLLEKFHELTPKIRGVYHPRIEAALKQNNRTLVNPFGRRIQFLGRMDDDLLREAYTAIPQGTESDQIKRAALNLRRRFPEVPILGELHDALVAMPKKEFMMEYAKAMKEELERPIDFSRCTIPGGELIVPADIKYSDTNYKDFKNLKVA